MADQIRMDSHKLLYHPERVAQWIEGKNIYPIEIEISPSGACNHRCIFCAVDYIGYKPNFLKKEVIIQNLGDMSDGGVRSIVCSGEGEPLLNKDLPEIVNKIKDAGIDVAMSSNGVLLTKEVVQECMKSFTWIRFSVASMETTSYKKIHRCADEDLDKVIANLAYAVEYKRERRLNTTLGVQCLLIPDNRHQIIDQAKRLRELGLDYFTIKPYSQHLHSNNKFVVDYNDMLELENELRGYETENYKIYFRAEAMKKMHHEKRYQQCYGLPFMTHIDAAGNVWPCIAHIGTDEFCYGNINDNSFAEIWSSKRRQKVTEKINACDINTICREACRLDEINKYLNQLKNPGEHVNFI